MIFPKNNNELRAKYRIDKKTKHLLTKILANQIAVIKHSDIDEIAAYGLIEKKVKAIINFSSSFSGTYPTDGLKKLLQARIPVFDVTDHHQLFDKLSDDHEVMIVRNSNEIVFIEEEQTHLLHIKEWNMKNWENVSHRASHNIESELNRFIDNTLEYVAKEKDFVLKPLPIPRLRTKMKGRHVVVVVRGNHYRQDLHAIRSYIEDYQPILIGVDGGADALIEYGLKPDIIIGDMDSVSDKALKAGSEIIVHAYPDRRAPGLERVQAIGVDAKIIPSVGTSEDVAMLMAYEEKASIIVALGAHSNMIDFLEKGRKGMASTILVRMKIGTKLVDAKGVSKLYQPRLEWRSLSLMAFAATMPIIAISLINHDMVRILQMMWINIKMIFT